MGFPTGWVRLPALSPIDDTVIHIWFGNASAILPQVTDPNGRNAVWGDYSYVNHCSFIDSTGTSPDAVASFSGLPGVVADGHPWGGAWLDFKGDDGIVTERDLLPLQSGTIQCWCRSTSTKSSQGVIGTRRNDANTDYLSLVANRAGIAKRIIGRILNSFWVAAAYLKPCVPI